MVGMANRSYPLLGGTCVIAAADALHQPHDNCNQAQSGTTRWQRVVP
jgi:hypothetical protein